MALHLFMDLKYQLYQSPVIPAGSKSIRQKEKGLVFLLIKPFQRAVQHPLAHQGSLVLIQNTKIRRKSLSLLCQKVGIFPKEGRAKSIYRLNIRLIDPQKLTL